MSSTCQRFTLDGSDSLETDLERTCTSVGQAVQSVVGPGRLQGLLLGGGYGRGEGGVLRTPDGDAPYNDLEFYVFVRDRTWIAQKALGRKLHLLGERMSAKAGVEVEFKVMTIDKLRRSPTTMFFYDLISGHRRLLGNEDLLRDCEHHRDSASIPLSEATRLLMNRCSGLLFSAEHLARSCFGLEEADFVGRNLAKAQLSFGDVLLTASQQYHGSCLERHERLKQHRFEQDLVSKETILAHHAAGVEFKLHPVRTAESRKSFAVRHAEITSVARKLWLWLESRRLGVPFKSASDYALAPMDKCPETGPWKNRLINLRTFGWRGMIGSGARYPRERLFNSLALMLFEEGHGTGGENLLRIQQALGTSASTFPDLVASYRKLWSQFN